MFLEPNKDSQSFVIDWIGFMRLQTLVFNDPATEKTCSHDVDVGWTDNKA